MRFTHLFIDRPILATVLSVFLTLIGLGALVVLPVSQYPEIVPPTVQVTTSYPGASAQVVSQTVATPLEQEINGVEDMIYMSSQSTGDGKLTITVTFRVGTDLNVAQMLTQNRVQDALPRLPEDVQRLGVQVQEGDPEHPARGASVLARRIARQPLSVELCDAACEGRAGAASGCGRRAVVRRPRLRDAHLARSRQGGRLQPQRRRGARGTAGAERAGLRRYPEPAADFRRRGVSDQRPDARPTDHAGAVRRHHPQDRRAGARDPHPRRRPGGDRRGRLRFHRLHGPQRGLAVADLRAARRELAAGGARSPRHDPGPEEGLPARR